MKVEKVVYIADGRSPIALNWMQYFILSNYQVHLVSMYPCNPPQGLKSYTMLPTLFTDFGEAAKDKQKIAAFSPNKIKRMLKKLAPPRVRTYLRHHFIPFQLPKQAKQLANLIHEIKPDFVHAMRIPYEGMLAALAMQGSRLPLLVSVWGNDFTLHSRSTLKMAELTKKTMLRADGLHTDCLRDVEIAFQWGFTPEKPQIVLPGAGGIQMDIFYMDELKKSDEMKFVINPRGFRVYVCNETFFKAIPLIKEEISNVKFLCPAMLGVAEAERWVSVLGLEGDVELMPPLVREEMAQQFQRAQVALSLTTHDGTPNTLLEAMACGCFPIAGELDSIREWIDDGENGFLVDPMNAKNVAQAVIKALRDDTLLTCAKEKNLQLIQERAAYPTVMEKAVAFYRLVATTLN